MKRSIYGFLTIVLILSFVTSCGVKSVSPPKEAKELAERIVIEYAKGLTYEMNDLQLKSSKKVDIDAADARNGIKERWSLSFSLSVRPVSGSGASEWSSRDSTIIVELSNGQWGDAQDRPVPPGQLRIKTNDRFYNPSLRRWE